MFGRNTFAGEQSERARMHLPSGPAARAHCGPAGGREVIENSLGHDRAAGVAGTKKENDHRTQMRDLSLKTLRGPFVRGLGAAARPAAALPSRFARPYKCAHEFALDLGCERVHVDALRRQKLPGILDVVDTGGFDLYLLESGARQL